MSNIPETERVVDSLMTLTPLRVLRWLFGWDLFSQLVPQAPRVAAPQGEPVPQQR